MPDSPKIVWFRQDLRLADNPALQAATADEEKVICIYVLDDETPGRWKAGGAARWWLHHSLKALGQAVEQKGGKLILRRGRADREVVRLAREAGARAVCWNRCYEPFAVKCEKKVEAALEKAGIKAQSFNGSLLYEPGSVHARSGRAYKTFSAFWQQARSLDTPGSPEGPPDAVPAPERCPASERLEAWRLLPRKPDWAGGLGAEWHPGEEGAARRLRDFLNYAAKDYGQLRDRPDRDVTSKLSPHLHHGEIGPRAVWAAVAGDVDMRTARGKSIGKFLSELGWREFSYHLLFHFPDLPGQSLRSEYRKFPWRPDKTLFRTWTRGETGYPFVDAGMRQLWQTGWMHNRVRMNVASFLIKHLLQPWQAGAEWFWDTLVDADLANNSVNWQWVAGCGTDAAPYFRIFNPVLQGERFDPCGSYVRRFVPELSNLPGDYIHKPWEAPQSVLAEAGVRLGEDYPYPIVDHKEGRRRALAAFDTVRGKSR